MGESNTLLYVIASFVLLHFVAGIIYLVYKISTAPPSNALDSTDTTERSETELATEKVKAP